jgi:hypothetical protein
MSELFYRPTVSREAASTPTTRESPERATAEHKRERPLL